MMLRLNLAIRLLNCVDLGGRSMPPPSQTTACHKWPAHKWPSRYPVAEGKQRYFLGPRFVCPRSRGQGQLCWHTPNQLTEAVQGGTPLLPARPPDRHQHRLRSCTYPGPTAASDLSQDDAAADGQLRTPVGDVQPRLTQEHEPVVAMSPQLLSQPLVGCVGLGREDQVGPLVRQAAAVHGQPVPADLLGRVTVTWVEAGPEQLSCTMRKPHCSPRPRRRHASTSGSLLSLCQDGFECLHVDRLDQVVIEPRLPGPLTVGILPVTGHRDQHRAPKTRLLTQPPCDFVSIHPWQPDIH